jgi:hypothetical protein
LTPDQVAAIKLPAVAHLVEIYDISKIINPKSKLSVVEKINHMIKLQDALLNKLELLREKKIAPGNNNNQMRLPVGPQGTRDNNKQNSHIAHDESDIEEEGII